MYRFDPWVSWHEVETARPVHVQSWTSVWVTDATVSTNTIATSTYKSWRGLVFGGFAHYNAEHCNVESNSSSPFSRKYCPLTAAYILSFHLNATMKSSPNYVSAWNIQDPTQELKDISPSSTMPWPTSKTTNDCVLFFFLCCELCIV